MTHFPWMQDNRNTFWWCARCMTSKAAVNTEFGAKIHLSLADGYAFLDEVGWDAYNEGGHMREYIERYRRRFGHYPAQVLADGIYCTRENRRMLKEKGIRLLAKPLGRPP